MGRPSLKNERKAQILDAYEACVARFGVEGASLERIAEQAGLARPLIRHHVGNRDALLTELIDRFIARSDQLTMDLIETLPKQDTSRCLIDWLFDAGYSDANSVLVAEALIAAGQNNEAIAKRMRDWTQGFVSAIAGVLSDEFRSADRETVNAVATGISGIYVNMESLAPLGEMAELRTQSKEAAILLIAALRKECP